MLEESNAVIARSGGNKKGGSSKEGKKKQRSKNKLHKLASQKAVVFNVKEEDSGSENSHNFSNDAALGNSNQKLWLRDDPTRLPQLLTS